MIAINLRRLGRGAGGVFAMAVGAVLTAALLVLAWHVSAGITSAVGIAVPLLARALAKAMFREDYAARQADEHGRARNGWAVLIGLPFLAASLGVWFFTGGSLYFADRSRVVRLPAYRGRLRWVAWSRRSASPRLLGSRSAPPARRATHVGRPGVIFAPARWPSGARACARRDA